MVARVKTGFQIGTYGVDFGTIQNGVRETAAMGGNLVRYQILAPDPRYVLASDYDDDFRNWSFEYYKAWWDDQINKIVRLCNMIVHEKLKVKIVVDCHSPFGGAVNYRGRVTHKICFDEQTRRRWELCWLDSIYALNRPEIACFDLCNEPAGANMAWHRAASKLARKIRKLTKKPISISTTNGHIDFKNFHPLEVSNIWYQVHFYSHSHLTQKAIKRSLRSARIWSIKHKKRIYVGEVGCNTQYHDPRKFFSLALPILNKYKWHWTIHAMNENPIFDYRKSAFDVIEGYL
ncbi:MAG: cellulase family glycosylhydrolase [Winogradskyella sp.]|uniref:glycoside hydrolase family 5 protein n=1 Tax=Winogradskyella sp. TaxID=1883156 RepID=UPI0018467ABD|nr:cellulase family glycosylhydrolase [Winogradskyella sp.]